jgi:hypothetical protein
MNTTEVAFAVVVTGVLALLCMAGIDYMIHKYNIRSREKSWEEIYKDAREEYEKRRISAMVKEREA